MEEDHLDMLGPIALHQSPGSLQRGDEDPVPVQLKAEGEVGPQPLGGVVRPLLDHQALRLIPAQLVLADKPVALAVCLTRPPGAGGAGDHRDQLRAAIQDAGVEGVLAGAAFAHQTEDTVHHGAVPSLMAA